MLRPAKHRSFLLLLALTLMVAGSAGLAFRPPTTSREDENPARTLYIIRHAKSDKSIAGLEDFDRPLDSSGVEDGKRMSAFLAGKHLCIDRIVYSPSVRTTQTMELLFGDAAYQHLKLADSSIYRCTDADYLNSIARMPDDVNCLVMIGHNPTTTNMANLLQKEKKFDEVPTCGVVAVELKIKSWSEIRKAKGKLVFWSTPKRLEGN